MSQETAVYKCSDYLDRRSRERQLCTDGLAHTSARTTAEEPLMDASCREKMCEWSFRVCDHFGIEREIVAIAISCLDRFVDRLPCDRRTFKLAAMTSLFMANKIFNVNKISVRSLVELSNGEFQGCHILEMEMHILQTLSWQVSPPTLHCFVEHLCAVLRSLFSDIRLIVCVYHRAIFFAELALCDITFLAEEKAVVAVASVLNAIEGLGKRSMTEGKREQFVEIIAKSLDLVFCADDMERVCYRLWCVYGMSVQCQEDESAHAGYQLRDVAELTVKQKEKGVNCSQLSPVCVTSS